jgi:hypothetical protein
MGQGMFPQPGAGKLAVADWWLTILVAEEVVAAAAPATTTNKANMRMASFIISNPLRFEFAEYVLSAQTNPKQSHDISTVISLT